MALDACAGPPWRVANLKPIADALVWVSRMHSVWVRWFPQRVLWSGSGTGFDSWWVALGVVVSILYLLLWLVFTTIGVLRRRAGRHMLRKEVWAMFLRLLISQFCELLMNIACSFVGGFLLQARGHVRVVWRTCNPGFAGASLRGFRTPAIVGSGPRLLAIAGQGCNSEEPQPSESRRAGADGRGA